MGRGDEKRQAKKATRRGGWIERWRATAAPALEAVGENAEALVDAMSDDEVLKAVPVVGTAVKVFKTVDKAKALILASKLEGFVLETKTRSADAAETIRRKVEGSEDEAGKIGEAITYVIDRATDGEKPRLVARLFVGFLEERITGEELRRLLFAIDGAFIEDLNKLLEWQMTIHPSYGKDWIPFLLGSGFARVAVSTKYDSSDVTYELTPLAHLLRKAVD